MSAISKTVITLTVLHRADEPLSPSLDDVLYEITEGGAVGWETNRVSSAVAPDAVQSELIALGNDGTFFDDDDDDEVTA